MAQTGWHYPLPTVERAAQEHRLVTAEARRPFDLAQGPLLRVWVLRLAADEHLLLLTLHHIVADTWSLGLLVREWKTIACRGFRFWTQLSRQAPNMVSKPDGERAER